MSNRERMMERREESEGIRSPLRLSIAILGSVFMHVAIAYAFFSMPGQPSSPSGVSVEIIFVESGNEPSNTKITRHSSPPSALVQESRPPVPAASGHHSGRPERRTDTPEAPTGGVTFSEHAAPAMLESMIVTSEPTVRMLHHRAESEGSTTSLLGGVSEISLHTSGQDVRQPGGSGDSPPRYKLGAANTPHPFYPATARRRGFEGRVLVRLDVAHDGRVLAATVVESSGFDILDGAALDTLLTWRLEPAHSNGQTKSGQVLVPIRFRLDS